MQRQRLKSEGGTLRNLIANTLNVSVNDVSMYSTLQLFVQRTNINIEAQQSGINSLPKYKNRNGALEMDFIYKTSFLPLWFFASTRSVKKCLSVDPLKIRVLDQASFEERNILVS